MTIDEAIEHCKEIICEHNECANEHKQLVQWLTELKEYKEQKFEQKPAEWSEKDTRIRKAIIDNIQAICEEGYFVGNIDKDILIDWLKSLRPQKQWKPTKEELRALENVFSLDIDSWDEDILHELYKQLKQL